LCEIKAYMLFIGKIIRIGDYRHPWCDEKSENYNWNMKKKRVKRQ
jgi:hypothetical protein